MMKKITSLVIGCSLALAGGAMAQAPDASPSATPKGKPGKPERHAPAAAGENRAEGKAPGQRQASEQAPGKQHGRAASAQGGEHAASQPGAPNAQPTPAAQPGKAAGHKGRAQRQGTPAASVAPQAQQNAQPGGATAQPAPSAAAGKHRGQAETNPTAPGGRGKHNKQAPAASATAAPSPTASAVASATPSTAASPKPSASATASQMHSAASPSATASASAATTSTSATPTSSTAAVAAKGTPKPDSPAVTKKPAPQQVQQIKQQTASFHAQPRPEIAPPVQFNPSYRIANAERWQGPQYEVYRSYRPERHDAGYYRSRYHRVELIGGGYYYFNNGYWYPAWGYNPSNEYYAYDAPVYVGRSAEPADRVIASVQAELKDMGYYKGEVDGLLGPLTRHALLDYQSDAGLQVTEVIDEPTLDSLNLAS